MSVKYVEDHFKTFESKQSPCRPYGQGADGYGQKIAMPYMLRLDDKGPWRRVYCVQISNAGSVYVVVKGERYFIHNDENLKHTGKWGERGQHGRYIAPPGYLAATLPA